MFSGKKKKKKKSSEEVDLKIGEVPGCRKVPRRGARSWRSKSYEEMEARGKVMVEMSNGEQPHSRDGPNLLCCHPRPAATSLQGGSMEWRAKECACKMIK